MYTRLSGELGHLKIETMLRGERLSDLEGIGGQSIFRFVVCLLLIDKTKAK